MTATAAATLPALDAQALRADFPALQQTVHGRPLVYLDSAASSQTPRRVLDALLGYYENDRSNVHRGVHELSQRATDKYESARIRLQRFLNASGPEEIVWTRGTTESINLVAATWGRANVRAGDDVIISAMEHHSNIVPWQVLCQEKGANLRIIPMSHAGELRLSELDRLLSGRPRIVAVTQVSNALGTVNPVREIAERAHAAGAVCLVDGAQAAPHLQVDVRALGCDFFALSGHKMCGPTGIGALYARRALLEEMPPYQTGGDMISSVRFEKTVYNELPYRFEAGTPMIAGAIAMGAAVDYLENVGMERIAAHEADLLHHGTERLCAIRGLRLIGTARDKASVLSFEVEGAHPADLGTLLDRQGIALRVGHHCAEPVMRFYGVAATTRASLAFYNTRSDLDALGAAIETAKEILA
ncbi:MAG: SufS family cysteine desulfurase [Bryobacterales bacterium]|nr:SufS family cysteine desulfurase [Bryobacterales bacterium]MDE0628982.1 SufS family cysteine desulfurase [Bryobacterales bacterium]